MSSLHAELRALVTEMDGYVSLDSVTGWAAATGEWSRRLSAILDRHVDAQAAPDVSDNGGCGSDIDGWIPWHGGARPVDAEAIVDVCRRGGEVAGDLDWVHLGTSGDVTAYRVVKAAGEGR